MFSLHNPHYNRKSIRLLRGFFCQTDVLMIIVFKHMQNRESQDPQPTLMFQVTKSKSQAGILRELSFAFTLPPTAFKLTPEETYFLRQCNFLQASSKVKMLSRGKKVDPKKFPNHP